MLLTIAIPTFNRPDKLQQRINQFSKLNPKVASRINILICDNGNLDFKIPANIGSLRLDYLKNSTNLGLGGNIESCIMNATGTFTWLLSDDDYIEIDYIEELLKRLESTKSDVIALGTSTINLSEPPDSQNFYPIPTFWQDFIFISGCIYRTEKTQNFISKRLHGEINATYHQVLVALGMFVTGFTLERLSNKYVTDTNTGKNYQLRSAFVVRILDLVKLENQLQHLGMSEIQLREIFKNTNSKIVNYIPRMVFEFSNRKDFCHLFQLLQETLTISRKKIKRMIILVCSFILTTLAILDFRVARASVYILTFISRKNFMPLELGGFHKKLPLLESDEASTLGYERN